MQTEPLEDFASRQMMRLSNGTLVSQAISVAASLGVADQLASGPRPVDEIAAAVGADAPTLYRLLRALADVELFQELDGRCFALTELSELLRTGVPGSMRNWAIMMGMQPWHGMCAGLLDAVRTGEPAFERIFEQPPFEYLRDHPDSARVFDAAMTDNSAALSAAVVGVYDFGSFRTVVDVGGGNGALLAAVLAANPGLRGVLFDMPEVVPGTRRVLADAGVADRCNVVAGDFFDSVPSGGDAYLLSHVIHDWDDERSVQILTNCRAAMADGGRVVLAEDVLSDKIEPSMAKWTDLHMLLIGGRQRTESEFAALFRRAGLEPSRVVPAGVCGLVEAIPA
ncbi:MAG: methyltransferase [Streptosporangiales bacterium]|nr:methyltransferase [Streptosporangiales bacterium]